MTEDNYWLSESPKGFFFDQEEVYFLTDILEKGGCMWCLNKRCKNTSRHGIPFGPDVPEAKAKYILDIFSKYVSKPTYANGIHTIFQNHKFDQFEDKKIIFAICDYFKGNCSNCYESRIQKIKINDNDSIAVCYPSMKVVRSKVTVGLHANIKIVFKGAKYEFSLIPIDVQPSKKIAPIHKEPRPYKQDYVVEQKHEKNSTEEEMWPSLCHNDKKFVSPKSVVDYTKLKENIINNELEQESIQQEEELPIVEPIKECIEYENDDLYWQKKLNENLFHEILDLKETNKQLQSKIYELENKNKRDKSISDNKDVYNEILRNIKTIGNEVSRQILETEYEKYIVS
jgi:hypothetical protein